jgi:hypothetical protein
MLDLDVFYKIAVVIKITIDVIELSNNIHTKYKQYKNYHDYINERLQYGHNSDLHNQYEPFPDENY